MSGSQSPFSFPPTWEFNYAGPQFQHPPNGQIGIDDDDGDDDDDDDCGGGGGGDGGNSRADALTESLLVPGSVLNSSDVLSC